MSEGPNLLENLSTRSNLQDLLFNSIGGHYQHTINKILQSRPDIVEQIQQQLPEANITAMNIVTRFPEIFGNVVIGGTVLGVIYGILSITPINLHGVLFRDEEFFPDSTKQTSDD